MSYRMRCDRGYKIQHSAAISITVLTLSSVYFYTNNFVSVGETLTRLAGYVTSGSQTARDIQHRERWWSSNITVSDVLVTSLNSPHSIEVNMASVRQLRDWNGNDLSTVHGKASTGSVIINMHDAPSDLYVNTKENGIAKIMNEYNFKGVKCIAKVPTFSKENNIQTALASYPRSGNTWTRLFLEQLSGIVTGSIYKAPEWKHVLRGEGDTKNVVVIKTHQPYRKNQTMNYDNAIVLIRSPEDSILSFFHYKKTNSPIATLNMSAFSTSGLSVWKQHVQTSLLEWKNFYYSWLQSYTRRLMILSYGKLQQDFFNEVFRVGHFLNISMTYKTLWCVYQTQEEMFHRKHSGVVTKSTVYTDDIMQQIQATKAEVAQRIKNMFGIDRII